MNYVGYYREEFNSAARNDIITFMRNIAIATSYGRDLLVAAPEIDTIICRNGWFTFDEYARIYGEVRVKLDPETGRFTAEGDNPFLLLEDPSVRKNPACLILLLDSAKIQKDLVSLLDDRVAGVSMVLEDQLLFSADFSDKKPVTASSMYRSPKLQLTLSFCPMDISGGLTVFLLASAVLLLLLLLCSRLIYHHLMQPVRSLVLENGGEESDFSEPFEYVRSCIEELKIAQVRLLNENRSWVNQLDQLLCRAREDILYGMLHYQWFNFDDPDVLSVFPWMHEERTLCLFLLPLHPENIATEDIADRIDQGDFHAETRTDAGCVMLIWITPSFTDEEKEEYRQMLRQTWGERNDLPCFCSPLFHGIDHLYDVYRALETEARRGMTVSAKEQPAQTEEAKAYVDYIDKHYREPELNIVIIADAFGKHRTIISKGIKAITGQTFTDYLRSRRIQEAMERIRQGNANIMQTAMDVGYVNYTTFKRAFVQVTGLNPMEYREKAGDTDVHLVNKGE